MRRAFSIYLTLLAAVVACQLGGPDSSLGQTYGQVTVTPTADKLIAWSAAGGGVEESLEPGEAVIASSARGHTGFAQTSTRLLGFSAGLRQWREVRLGVEERIERYHLLPFLILAHSNQEVHGFQETRGHWTSVALGPSEKVSRLRGSGHVAAAITNDRAIGFSTYTGGFYEVDWTPNERVVSVDGGQNALVIRTSSRTLVLKSQSTGWTEVR